MSECLEPPKFRSSGSSNIADTFRLANTFPGKSRSLSINDLVQKAVLQTPNYPSDIEDVDFRFLELYPRHHYLPHGPQFDISIGHPISIPSESKFLHFPAFQSPPILKFGQSMTGKSCTLDCRSTSSLANSLFIEYLARVSYFNTLSIILGFMFIITLVAAYKGLFME